MLFTGQEFRAHENILQGPIPKAEGRVFKTGGNISLYGRTDYTKKITFMFRIFRHAR